MQTKAKVPKTPLNISNFLFLPQGFIFFSLIMNNVIIKLNNDLNSTNSNMGILLSIFFTHKVIKLKKNEAKTKLNLFYELNFFSNTLSFSAKPTLSELNASE